jgi:exosortase A
MSAVLLGNHIAVPDRWRKVLPALLVLLTGLLLIYRHTALAMVDKWAHSATFTHAFLVAPIALWLIWQKRDALARHSPRPSPWLLLAIGGVALVWLVGEVAQVNAITQFALVALLVAAVPAIIGVPAAREIRFPLAFLFFAVPIGSFLFPPMMTWTADFTVAALRLTGIPVYREGQQLVIPTGTWSVVEACAGVRYLIASLMMGSLFAYLNYTSLRRRLVFMGAAIIVPIVANWLRAYLIVLLGHVTDNRLAAGVDHLVYGWIFFGVFVVVMFAVGARWAEVPQKPAPRVAAPSAPAVKTGRPWAVAAGAVALAMLPPLVVQALEQLDATGVPELRAFEPAGGWRSSEARSVEWRPSFAGAAAESQHAYARADGSMVGLHVAYYRNQDQTHKLVSEDNTLVPSEDRQWLQLASAARTVDVGGVPVTFRTARFRSLAPAGPAAEGRLISWQLYWVNGRLTASDSMAKAYGALYRLLGRGDDSAHIVVYTLESQPGAGDARIEAFVRANLRLLEAQLRETRDGA